MSTHSALRHDAPSPAPVPVPRPAHAGGGGGPSPRTPTSLAELGTWMALAPIGMLFASLASAYIVRRGLGSGWMAVPLPQLVWWNTAVLLVSSATLEAGRRRETRQGAGGGLVWATFALGMLFLAGQVAAWMQLTARGIAVDTTAYGSFFYVLTGSHAVHLLGGVAALLAAALWPVDPWRRISRARAIRITSIYWHFLGVLWVGILLLLVLWR